MGRILYKLRRKGGGVYVCVCVYMYVDVWLLWIFVCVYMRVCTCIKEAGCPNGAYPTQAPTEGWSVYVCAHMYRA